MWCSRCWHGQEEQCQMLGAWQSWVLAPHLEKRVSFWVSFPPGNEKSQWSVHLCVFMWERRATRFLSHTYLCKNAKGGVICFLSVLFLAEEGVVIVCWTHSHRGLQQYFWCYLITNAEAWHLKALFTHAFRYRPHLSTATLSATTWLNDWWY